MKFILATAVLATATASLHENCRTLFGDFKKKFRRSYADQEEESKRLNIFCASMKRSDARNERAKGKTVFGVTKFSDRTEEEFSVLLGRKNKAAPVSPNHVVRQPKKVELNATSSVDWTSQGKVTPVKNQGQCGSCWAFSVAEQIESAWLMAGNAMWEFSPQQVASCTPKCIGCGGGDSVTAYEYLITSPGLSSAWYAPYTQSMYETCLNKRCTQSCDSLNVPGIVENAGLAGFYATVTGYEYATAPCSSGKCNNQDLATLNANLVESGPASVCLNASPWSDYVSGILTADECAYGASDMDHCVQLTGLNAEEGYYNIRNSWSTDWGYDGYIRLELNTNACGLANEATFVNLGNA